jgi:hypothetical protein
MGPPMIFSNSMSQMNEIQEKPAIVMEWYASLENKQTVDYGRLRAYLWSSVVSMESELI